MTMSINSIDVSNTLNENIKNDNIKALENYVNNKPLTQAPDTFTSNVKSGMSSSLLFEGLPFINLLRRNKKIGGKLISEPMKKLGEVNKNALNTLLHGEGKLSSRIFDYILSATKSKEEYFAIKSAAKKAAKKGAVKAEEKVAEKAAEKTAEKVGEKIAEKAAEETIEKAAEKTAETGVKKGIFGKLFKIGTKGAEQAGKKGILGKLGKLFKSSGAGIMLVFSGFFEMCSEVVPTFKELGFKSGMKQLGKSSVKVVGDTFGFIAGEQVGVALGTAIGTAIFPGIGSAVGAAAGFVGGLAGSFLMGKLTKSITGDSEREIVKNKQTEEFAKDAVKIEELKNAASEKINSNYQMNGELDEDSKSALEILNNLNNPFETSV